MGKALLIVVHVCLVLAGCSFTVYGEQVYTESSMAMPPSHYHTITPATAPSPHHHHHHHHSHPPTAPPAHAPSHHHHHHHPHPPAHAPAHTPAHAPAHPPSHVAPAHPPPPHVAPAHPPPPHVAPAHPPPPHVAPAHPPTPTHRFPRSLVEVQGVVYCKSCKYAGADTLLGATAVLGATVKLQCNNTKYPLNVVGTTDKNGYFRIKAPKTITSYGAHKCKLFLVTSPSASCAKPSNLHGGATGAVLRPESLSAGTPPVALYTVGPLAFEPKCPH
ncbi:hypothetical protein WN943_012445 [Citrus x changshan-huyou]|uniref:Pollen Ole e 1 allergen and extensin family protein n=1 Tax=Citrus limon TaxID=2708 RepID=A0A1S8AE12_CITLI|nr:non-classical arabinogalactan protein 31 [Citrus x clementina]